VRAALFCEPHGHAIAVEVPLPMDLELDFNLCTARSVALLPSSMWGRSVCTSQFVAVSGILEKSQPDCVGMSEVSRICLVAPLGQTCSEIAGQSRLTSLYV
jgi:hypothetical protein